MKTETQEQQVSDPDFFEEPGYQHEQPQENAEYGIETVEEIEAEAAEELYDYSDPDLYEYAELNEEDEQPIESDRNEDTNLLAEVEYKSVEEFVDKSHQAFVERRE